MVLFDLSELAEQHRSRFPITTTQEMLIMKLKSLIGLAGGIAVGYVLGTAAGRARFEQLKSRADAFVHDPKVQQTVSDLAGQVKANAHYIPSPAASVVGSAAGHLQDALKPKSDEVHS